MKWISLIATILVETILKLLAKAKPTMTKSDGKGSTETALKRKIIKKWGKKSK